jgi:hypothetical protein
MTASTSKLGTLLNIHCFKETSKMVITSCYTCTGSEEGTTTAGHTTAYIHPRSVTKIRHTQKNISTATATSLNKKLPNLQS